MATLVPKTLGPGKDYANITALEAANANLVALDEAWEVTCDNFEDALGGTLTWAGWVTSPTCYLKIKASSKHGSTGQITTNSYRITIGDTSLMMTVGGIGDGGFIWWDGIQFSGGANFVVGSIADATGVATWRFTNCVFYGNYLWIRNTQAKGPNWELYNCYMIERTYNASYAGGFVLSAQGCKVVNCTMVYLGNTSSCLVLGSHNPTYGKTFKNVYACAPNNGATATGTGTNVTKTDLNTDDTYGDVQNVPYDTSNFKNVGAGTEDLRLVDSSAMTLGGTSLVGEPAPWNVAEDVNGNPRILATPSVGAYEPSQGNAMWALWW